MRLYNSLTRSLDELVPIEKGKFGVYTCGPTVYSTATIGNFRTYTVGDLLVRTLRYLGYDVRYVMNLTDVGHLTGDNDGDPDTGEDRLEKGARREGLSAWDVANKYAGEFVEHMKLLGLVSPDYLVRATEHISDQIKLVQDLEKRGLTYRTSDGIYFDVKKFESMGYRYGELSTLDKRMAGARVRFSDEKRDVRDFALWKFSPSDVRRQMEWDSPWGVGFPGWHIECSAMSMRYLGTQFDIHVGGEDLRSTHHPNEIAQSEGATGKSPFVKYWLHVAFMLVDGGRMGKSLGNAYTLNDVVERGYNPLSLRYLYLTSHYRKQQNFTWDTLESSDNAFKKLVNVFSELDDDGVVDSGVFDKYKSEFVDAISDDLSMPEALSVVWSVVRDDGVNSVTKLELLRDFDRVLGLDLGGVADMIDDVPRGVMELVKERERLRSEKRYDEADAVRDRIVEMGYEVRDEGGKSVVRKIVSSK